MSWRAGAGSGSHAAPDVCLDSVSPALNLSQYLRSFFPLAPPTHSPALHHLSETHLHTWTSTSRTCTYLTLLY